MICPFLFLSNEVRPKHIEIPALYNQVCPLRPLSDERISEV